MFYVRLIEDFGAHVAFRANSRVLGHVHFAGGLRVSHCQTEISNHASTIRLNENVFAFYVAVSDGRFALFKCYTRYAHIAMAALKLMKSPVCRRSPCANGVIR